MPKYVVSLTTEARRAKRMDELRSVIEGMADVVVVEGGRNALTVMASDSALAALKDKVAFAHVEPHTTLALLKSG